VSAIIPLNASLGIMARRQDETADTYVIRIAMRLRRTQARPSGMS
jgi:hypothetical protein